MRFWCLKWVWWPIWILKTYGHNNDRESNCQFDSQPLKVRNFPNLFACRWHATNLWKALDKGYNFALNLTLIRGFQKKLLASKVARVPISKNLGLPTWESYEKMTFGCRSVAMHKQYYKGEGGDFPKYGLWWILWVCVCHGSSMHQKCSNYALTTFVVWFMQVHVSNWPACHFS